MHDKMAMYSHKEFVETDRFYSLKNIFEGLSNRESGRQKQERELFHPLVCSELATTAKAGSD